MFLFPAESLLWLGFVVCNEFLMATAKHYGHVWASKAFIEVLDKFMRYSRAICMQILAVILALQNTCLP
jgi:hypothetical protein